MDDYVTKPIRVEQLVEALMQVAPRARAEMRRRPASDLLARGALRQVVDAGLRLQLACHEGAWCTAVTAEAVRLLGAQRVLVALARADAIEVRPPISRATGGRSLLAAVTPWLDAARRDRTPRCATALKARSRALSAVAWSRRWSRSAICSAGCIATSTPRSAVPTTTTPRCSRCWPAAAAALATLRAAEPLSSAARAAAEQQAASAGSCA